MRKTYIAICATAALGLCLIGPNGASAFPAADSASKVYSQTATSKNAVTSVRWAGRGYGGRIGFGRGFGYRGIGYGRGFGWRGVGLGRGYGWRGGWRRAGFHRGYYGGYGGYGGYGLGWGGGWPFGLGLGLGAAATDWGGGYPYYYGGGYYPAYYGGGGCYY